MSIIKPMRPQNPEDFIGSAPDAGAPSTEKPKRVMKGKQAQISHALPPELLDELDKFVKNNPGLKRGQAINIAIRQMIQNGITLNLRTTDRDDQS